MEVELTSHIPAESRDLSVGFGVFRLTLKTILSRVINASSAIEM